LLDQLALYGRPPPYPSPNKSIRDDLQILTPSRSLSPTTISAASQSTMYTVQENSRISNHMLPIDHACRKSWIIFEIYKKTPPFATTRYSHATISTTGTPDSFAVEILGDATSDDSTDNQYEINGNSEPMHQRTFADVSEGHDAYVNDDDSMSYQSDNKNTNTVQRHLQMS
jgi:hypothetical protein